MSSLWTPGGERPVGRPGDEVSPPPPAGPGPAGTSAGDEPTEEELREYAAQLRQQIAGTPAAAFVIQSAVQMFEIAGVHLSLQPPQIEEARTAIDAMAALVEGLRGRLGPDEQQLLDGLAQIRLAFVQIQNAAQASPGDDA